MMHVPRPYDEPAGHHPARRSTAGDEQVAVRRQTRARLSWSRSPCPSAAPSRRHPQPSSRRATAPAAVAAAPLTNLAHLDFLLDEATLPAEVEGHTTYRLADEPTLILPWTYADAQPDGTFRLVGGGPLDEATNTWGQGAYNADDIARAAVVYLRHWELTDVREAAAPARTSCSDRSPTCRRPTDRTRATSCCGCSPTAV